ncbi:phosphate/phosphite/phosphonate ABC transporter substrate-binding protein [Oceanispirochaeta crateris]|uniref:Phosphate/phosphite/phosphonate ABC transporter substrate-binding protein n=1 Tax=Oceanispirochaeta crateris TaxID=2518645 RepID=A0A5C1QQS7_9SPIO|nr:phosphate/phosphite/phosphonate ABC transporter substrate-binding protein [Oceanispirochaeta crateris]QEN08926.1 phosphate/phosphite/phosphonate ABC transporter substrate-binding protein [Oceanispirochaeta crateris]
MKKSLFLMAFIALIMTSFVSAGGSKETDVNPDVLEVQLIPSRDATYLDAQRLPLQELLAKEMGMEVNVTVATDYNALIEAMASEQVHVGLLATTAYVLAADEGAAEAILKSLRYDVDDNGELMKDKPMVSGYKSQLIADKDSGIKSVIDLKGRKVAISSFTSTSGFVWPANLLADNGIDPESEIEWINTGGHDNAVLAVFNGEADAAFTFKDARNLFEKESYYADLMDKVVLIANTSLIPNDTISVIPRLNEDLKQKVKDAFIAISKSEEGLEIVRGIYNHEGYEAAQDSDYDEVRVYLERKNEWDF